MAWTQAQIDSLKSAYAKGIRRLQFGDQTLEFHSMSEMADAIARMEREVNSPRTFRRASIDKGY